MKASTFCLSVVSCIVLLATACQKDKLPTPIPVEPGVNKTLELRIGKGQSFNESAFDHVVAQVGVSLYRVNRETGASLTIWDTLILDKHIRSFPLLSDATVRTVQVTNVVDSKEMIQLNWTASYRDTVTNYRSMWARLEPIANGLQFKQVSLEL